MPRAVFLLVALSAGLGLLVGQSAKREAPSYSATSVVNSASNQTGTFAPNTFVTIYGSNLCYITKAMFSSDIQAGNLPTTLPGANVAVVINHVRAHLYFVSPGQINVLIPSDAVPGPGELQVVLDGTYGPRIPIDLQPSAPALFQMDTDAAIAVHADGALLTAASPGRPGEDIVLYATGLGSTTPQATYGEIPVRAAPLRDTSRFRVLLDGTPVDPARVYYAGVSPGFAGLFQINVKLPDQLGANPEIRLQTADNLSKAGVVLRARPQ